MKISNNALTFLLAQYRAIFKQAYIKGLASAVLLTAGLSTAAAAADPVTSLDTINNAVEEDTVSFDKDNLLQLVVNSGDKLVLEKNLEITLNNETTQYPSIKAGTTNAKDNTVVLDGNGKNITINGSTERAAFTFGASQNATAKLKINDLGTLTINDAMVNLTTSGGSKQLGVDIGAAKVVITNGAQVNLNNKISTNPNNANAMLRGTEMVIEGADTEVNIGNSTVSGSSKSANTKAVFGYEEEYNADGSPKYAGSNTTINDATINFWGAMVKQNTTGSLGYAARIQAKKLTATNAVLNVKDFGITSSTSDYVDRGAGATYNVYRSTLTDSFLTIEDQASLTLELREFNKEAYNKAQVNGNDDEKSKNAIGRDFNGSLTIDGGVVVVDGVLRNIKGGLLEIKDGTQLTGGSKFDETTNKKFDNSIYLGIYNDASSAGGSFSGSTLATLRLSSTTLDQFLNSEKEEIKDKADKPITDKKGQLVLHHGARIELTDQNQVEISKFTFDNDGGLGKISTTVDGSKVTAVEGDDVKIGSENDKGGKVDGTRTIVASNMSIGKSLLVKGPDVDTGTKNADHVKSGNASYAFRFEANDLTVGSEKGSMGSEWAGFDSKSSKLGVNELRAHKSITFVDGQNDAYYLQDNVVLDTTTDQSEAILGEVTDAQTGTIKGDDLVVSGGKLDIRGGNWSTTQGQDLTLADGSITVSAKKGEQKNDGLDLDGTNNDTYYAGGVATSLTVKGGSFVIDKATAASKAPTITVTGASGATAFLDLRDASVKWGSGSITVTGDAVRDSKSDILSDAGEGQVLITGAQFKDYIGEKSQTSIKLGDDGVLFADGTISGDINVDKFGTTSKSGAVYFSGAGTFATTGALSIVAEKADVVLAIGPGHIDAPSITLSNKENATKNKGDLSKDVFTVSGGTLEVGSNLSSSNSVIAFTKNGENTAHLVLDTDDNNASGLVSAHLRFDEAISEGYALEVDQGQWALAEGKDAYFSSGANFHVGASQEEYAIQGATASLSLDNLNITGTSSNNVIAQGGSLTVNTMQAGSGATFNVNGQFTINGRSDIDSGSTTEISAVKKAAETAGLNLAKATFNVTGADAQLKLGSAATSLIKITSGDANTVTVDKALGDAVINLDKHGMLYLDLASGTTITAQNAKDLKAELVDSMGNGILNVGSGSLDIKWDDETNLVTSWDKVKDFANVKGVTSDKVMATLVNNIEVGTVVTGGHYGALATNFAAPTSVQVDGDLGLHQARNGGYFVFSSSTGKEVGVGLAADASLLLDGAGKIGAIDGADGSELVITAGQFSGAATGTTEILGHIKDVSYVEVGNDTTVAGDISAGELRLEAGTTLSNDTHDTIVTTADVLAGASFATENLTFDARNGRALGYNDSWLMGDVTVGDTLKLQANGTDLVDADGHAVHANEVIVAGGTLRAVNTVLDAGSALLVGLDAKTRADTDADDGIDQSASYTGAFETESLDFNGGALIVDPDQNHETALASVRALADASTVTDSKVLGTLDGSVFVGQNAAVGMGTWDLAELREVIAQYQVDGKLVGGADHLGSILYLDGITRLSDGEGIALTGLAQADYQQRLTSNGKAVTADGVLANSIYFGDSAALLISAEAMNYIGQENTAALVTFAGNNGKLIADGGEILISGDLRATSYQLFTDGDKRVEVEDLKGNESSIEVSTANGFLIGTLSSANGADGGKVTLSVNEDAHSMDGASAPVYQTLVAYAQGYNREWTDASGATQRDDLYNGYVKDPTDGTQVKNYEYHNQFLSDVISHGYGADAEAAARLGVYGGAPQAALSAGKSSTDAIASRFGIGAATSNLTLSGNTQGATLWLAPVYKSADSDGFEAQGVDYGVNVDLYGVALGADYTLGNGVTFGAMFNVGSGDIDGEGAAAAVSNDFDYYGFGVYAGYSVGQFSVIGDVSYTVADNEIEANTSVDKIGAKMDSSNLSLGVTGKYALEFNGVSVTPHAGLRFSNIDLDDYTIDGEDVVASVDSDSLNLFAIPVGVTIAKEFKGESWTVAPSFDLTLTGQFGDDELDGDVSWAGVSNLTTHTTTEVIDNFTYGATLGVEAQSVGGIALGLSVGYTGSSNTDEFGVNANARFTF